MKWLEYSSVPHFVQFAIASAFERSHSEIGKYKMKILIFLIEKCAFYGIFSNNDNSNNSNNNDNNNNNNDNNNSDNDRLYLW